LSFSISAGFYLSSPNSSVILPPSSQYRELLSDSWQSALVSPAVPTDAACAAGGR